MTPDDIWRLRQITEPQVSPTGAAIAFTVTDPDRLTAVWSYEKVLRRAPKGKEMEEVVCENNRNAPVNGVTVAK